MEKAQAAMVNAGMMTSSLAPIPKAAKARCNAVVPFVVDTPCLHPQYSANPFSNSGMYLPADEIQLVFRHSLTYSHSLPVSSGSHTGIIEPHFARATAITFQAVSLTGPRSSGKG